MLLLLFLLVHMCRSEWPPFSCDPQVSIDNDVVTLTSPEQQEREYVCKLQQTYNEFVFIQFQKKYSKRIFKKSHDSIFGITVINKDEPAFTLRVHNDRIETDATNHQCFGLFTSKKIWLRIKIHSLFELRKTFVSIHTAKNSVYTSCMKFEVDGVFENFRLKLHAITDTGMHHLVHSVTKNPPKSDQDITQLEKEFHVLKDRLRVLEKFMETAVHKLTQNRVLVHEKHDEMKRTLKHSHSVNEQKVKTHSIGVVFCFAIIGIILMFCIKVNGYKHWSREHIL